MMQKIQFQRSAGMVVFSEADFEKISNKLINNNIELEEVEFATKEDLLALEVGLKELENGETTSLEKLLKMRPDTEILDLFDKLMVTSDDTPLNKIETNLVGEALVEYNSGRTIQVEI